MKRIFFIGILAALLFLLNTLPSNATAISCPWAEDNLEALQQKTTCLLNAERSQRNLPLLALNPQLTLAAQRHAQDMAQRKYQGHTAPSPAPYGKNTQDRVIGAGYGSSSVMESLPPAGNADYIPTFLKNNTDQDCLALTNPSVSDLGIGFSQGKWVILFASPNSIEPGLPTAKALCRQIKLGIPGPEIPLLSLDPGLKFEHPKRTKNNTWKISISKTPAPFKPVMVTFQIWAVKKQCTTECRRVPGKIISTVRSTIKSKLKFALPAPKKERMLTIWVDEYRVADRIYASGQKTFFLPKPKR